LTFAYSAIGNITSYAGTGTATAAPGNYSYAAPAVTCNGASVAKPHAVTGTSGNAGSYAYDCNGSMTTRTMNGVTQTLAYNVYGRLATVTVGAQVTTNTYDANGQRVIRQNPNGDKTLYLGDVEITKPAAGVISYARNYKLGDETVALRVGTSGGSGDALQWIIGNQQGSTSIAVNNGTTTTSKNSYLPYGGLRGADAITTTDHGFLNQVEDATTGLDYLNARYLDPVLGRFISVDPIIEKTQDAYGYGFNNPTTYSDPTGLWPRWLKVAVAIAVVAVVAVAAPAALPVLYAAVAGGVVSGGATAIAQGTSRGWSNISWGDVATNFFVGGAGTAAAFAAAPYVAATSFVSSLPPTAGIVVNGFAAGGVASATSGFADGAFDSPKEYVNDVATGIAVGGLTAPLANALAKFVTPEVPTLPRRVDFAKQARALAISRYESQVAKISATTDAVVSLAAETAQSESSCAKKGRAC
jgi:RHS repeat-associated protein